MPNSFSRFLSDEELQRVRELYLESIKESDQDEAEQSAEATASTTAQDTGAER